MAGDLRVKGEPKPIGVTPGHLFWSVDRQEWVSVGDLRPGETVKTLGGTTTVESYTMRDHPEPVYNLEVSPDHVFRVGELGILVHNTSDPCATKCKKWNQAKKQWDVDPGLPEQDGPYADLYGTDSEPIGTGAASLFTRLQRMKILTANRNRNPDMRLHSDDPLELGKLLYEGGEEIFAEWIAAGTIRLNPIAGGRWEEKVEGGGGEYWQQIYIRKYEPTKERYKAQATIDHIRAKSTGGSNSYCNARVHSRRRGSQKGDRSE